MKNFFMHGVTGITAVATVYLTAYFGLLPAPQHDRLLRAVSSVMVENQSSLDAALLHSEDIANISPEYRMLKDEYDTLHARITASFATEQDLDSQWIDRLYEIEEEMLIIGRESISQ